jgi:heme/copper-type cytochrome/quinol oxidase subunit 1
VTSLVRRFLRTAIAFLVVGIAIGLWLMARREIGNVAPSAYLVSAHTHAILVGFVMMMILGVALWMFPRPAKGDRVYRPAQAEAAYWLVTLGTVARVAGELVRDRVDEPWLRWAVLASGAAQGFGLLVFFATMWTRIRPVGSRTREAEGERF